MSLSQLTDLFEALTILCFGLSWPISIRKSWISRTAKGKSLGFELIIVFGYCIGVLGKLITYSRTGVLPYSTWFYLADIAMVLCDIALYFRNRALDRAAEY